jgi:hypothetical protein
MLTKNAQLRVDKKKEKKKRQQGINKAVVDE